MRIRQVLIICVDYIRNLTFVNNYYVTITFHFLPHDWCVCYTIYRNFIPHTKNCKHK